MSKPWITNSWPGSAEGGTAWLQGQTHTGVIPILSTKRFLTLIGCNASRWSATLHQWKASLWQWGMFYFPFLMCKYMLMCLPWSMHVTISHALVYSLSAVNRLSVRVIACYMVLAADFFLSCFLVRVWVRALWMTWILNNCWYAAIAGLYFHHNNS